MIVRMISLVLVVFLLMMSSPSVAGCYTSGSGIQNLGNFSSIEVGNSSYDLNFSSSFACDGFVNLLDYSRIDATLIDAEFNLTSTSGSQIAYTLYTDSSYSDPFLIGETVEFGSFNLIDLLGLFSNVDGTLPLYLRTLPANIPAGNYQDLISILWSWDYCSGISILFVCLGRDSGSEVVNVTVELTVTEACELISQDVNFGTVSNLLSANQANLNTEVTCTKELSYNIYVDAGDNFSNGSRHMVNGLNGIGYQLFGADLITPVGPSSSDSLQFVGSGSKQIINIVAKTEVANVFPTPGIYADSVRVVVNW